MNGGIIGFEFLLDEDCGLDLPEPLLSVSVIFSLEPFNDWPFVCGGGMSRDRIEEIV